MGLVGSLIFRASTRAALGTNEALARSTRLILSISVVMGVLRELRYALKNGTGIVWPGESTSVTETLIDLDLCDSRVNGTSMFKIRNQTKS
jgi:hypothetical protein